jgi:hypothetical protein
MTRLDETRLGDDGPTYADAMRASSLRAAIIA